MNGLCLFITLILVVLLPTNKNMVNSAPEVVVVERVIIKEIPVINEVIITKEIPIIVETFREPKIEITDESIIVTQIDGKIVLSLKSKIVKAETEIVKVRESKLFAVSLLYGFGPTSYAASRGNDPTNIQVQPINSSIMGAGFKVRTIEDLYLGVGYLNNTTGIVSLDYFFNLSFR